MASGRSDGAYLVVSALADHVEVSTDLNTMLQAFQEVFEESTKPVRGQGGEAYEKESIRKNLLAFVVGFERETEALSRRVRLLVMTKKAESIARISSNPIAAVARVDYRGFLHFQAETLKSHAETVQVRIEQEAFHRTRNWAAMPAQRDREFVKRIADRNDAGLAKRADAQHMLASFFGEMAEAAKVRFEYLTTDPDAYRDYAKAVSRENPTIMAYLAR